MYERLITNYPEGALWGEYTTNLPIEAYFTPYTLDLTPNTQLPTTYYIYKWLITNYPEGAPMGRIQLRIYQSKRTLHLTL
jgi:hypothetical protein